jgi:hypothetical protein
MRGSHLTKSLKTRPKKNEFKFNYNNNTNDFELSPIGNSASTLDNSSNQNLYNFKFDYSQPIKFSDEGKLSFGSLYEELLLMQVKELLRL